MQNPHYKRPLFLVFSGIFLLAMAAIVWLITPQPVAAQCGSQASSCKTCHEVQGQHPVNKDGTKWHESHAFGDFCAFCHAGNQQATDKKESHTGMVPPLSDIKSACQSCHAKDLQEKAQVYATILKVDLNSGGAAPKATAAATAASTAAAPAVAPAASGGDKTPEPTKAPAVASAPSSELVVDDPNAIDYVQRYNEIVLKQTPTNWGNIVLIALIGIVAVGGASFVLFNELKRSQALAATKRVEGEYPADIVDMLPALAALKPQSRSFLSNLLKHPKKTDKVLGAIDGLVSDEKSGE